MSAEGRDKYKAAATARSAQAARAEAVELRRTGRLHPADANLVANLLDNLAAIAERVGHDGENDEF